jgi:hypothetical protein
MKIICTIALLFIALNSFAQNGEWKSLFDGKTLNGWKQMTGSAPYTVENGELVGTTVPNSPNSFLALEQRYTGDFVLELEAKMTDTTTNSGVQFKSNFDAKANNGRGRV